MSKGEDGKYKGPVCLNVGREIYVCSTASFWFSTPWRCGRGVLENTGAAGEMASVDCG